jgi:acyl dehydratase
LYAEASGDHNAIHIDEEAAKKRGLPGIILHGICTMAYCQQAVVDRLCDGHPERLSSLSVQFSKPVFPGDRLLFKGGDTEGNRFRIQVETGDGVSVLRHVGGTVGSPAF